MADDGTIKSSHQLYGASIYLRMIAGQHFKDDCFERRTLLEIADYFNQLWTIDHNLKRVEHQLERVRALNKADPILIRQLAMSLDNIAPTVRGDDATKVVMETAAMLHIWADMTIHLEEMLRVSAAFRFLGGIPAGSA